MRLTLLPLLLLLCARFDPSHRGAAPRDLDRWHASGLRHRADEHGLKIPYPAHDDERGLIRAGCGGRQSDRDLSEPHDARSPASRPPSTASTTIRRSIPKGLNKDGWYWYANDIRVPTLFDAVAAARRVTANVEWPVTVGAKGIGFNIPEFRRAHAPDDLKLLEALGSPGWIPRTAGAPPGSLTRTTAARVSLTMKSARASRARSCRIRNRTFMTVHLIALDHESHSSRAVQPAGERRARTASTRWSRRSRKLRARMILRRSWRWCPDHGFATIKPFLNWPIPFAQAGLIKKGHPDASQVWMWNAAGAEFGCDAERPEGHRRFVRGSQRCSKSCARIRAAASSKILEGDSLKAAGGWPDASFILALKPGYGMGGAWSGEARDTQRWRQWHARLVARRHLRCVRRS